LWCPGPQVTASECETLGHFGAVGKRLARTLEENISGMEAVVQEDTPSMVIIA
jgi:hypothetical protein